AVSACLPYQTGADEPRLDRQRPKAATLRWRISLEFGLDVSPVGFGEHQPQQVFRFLVAQTTVIAHLLFELQLLLAWAMTQSIRTSTILACIPRWLASSSMISR